MRKWLKSGSTASQNATVWSAIKAGTPIHARMIFTDQNITLEDQDISIDSGITVNDIFNGDTDLVFGKTVCRQITVRILNSDLISGLGWTGEFKLQMWATISNVEYTCDIGYFKGEKPKNVTTAQYINFTAYDRMKLFDGVADDFWNSLTYPKTISQIYSALVSSVGLTGEMDNVPSALSGRSFSSVPADMEGYTKRDILGWIAEQCGSYAVITYEGKCSLKWFTDNTAHSVTGDQEWAFNSADLNPGLTWNEFDQLTNAQQEAMTLNDIAGYKEAYAVDELVVKQLNNDFEVQYPNNYGENIYQIVGNPFITVSSGSDVTSYVKPLFDRLATFGGYLPFEMSCLGDPAVEAGDIITVAIGSATITVPVFVKTMRWKRDITDEYETTGQIPRATYASNVQKEQYLENKSLRLFVDSKYYSIKSGIEITEDGVRMSGGKFIDILSGSRIDMESGSNINIKSGGNLNANSGGNINIKSGAKLDVQSGGDVDVESGGNVNIKSGSNLKLKSGGKLTAESGSGIDVASGGNVNVKSGGKLIVESGGDIDVESGGDVNVKSGSNINVKSGGNLKVASGGNIDIHGTGTLELTGSTVKIKSGSTFDVDSDNLKINSAYGEFTAINKYNGINDDFVFSIGRNYAASGLTYVAYFIPSQNISTYSGVTRYTYPLLLAIEDSVSVPNYTKKINMRFGTIYGTNPETRVNEYMPVVSFSATSKYGNTTSNENVFLYSANGIFDNYLYASKGKIGDLTSTTITYNTLISNSSRDIKHNINPLPSVGEKLDQLQPVTFVYDDDEQEKTRMGLIYEDTKEVMPEICTDDESNKAISYIELVPALLKEIQDLRKRVAELERRD